MEDFIMRKKIQSIVIITILLGCFIQFNNVVNAATSTSSITITADDKYQLYVNGSYIGSGDSWQNSQTFSQLPLTPGNNVIAVKASDVYKVIAGLIADLKINDTDYSTNINWKTSLVEYSGWNTSNFDDSAWKTAKDLGEYGVSPWYTNVAGLAKDTSAHWIWSPDDKFGTVYFRCSVYIPITADITMTADDTYSLYVNGTEIGKGYNWQETQTYTGIELAPGKNVIAVQASDVYKIAAGLLADVKVNAVDYSTNSNWKTSLTSSSGWTLPSYNDSTWKSAKNLGVYGVSPWYTTPVLPTSTTAQWIWSPDNNLGTVYFRCVIDVK